MGEGHIQGLLVEIPEVGSAFAGTNMSLGTNGRSHNFL